MAVIKKNSKISIIKDANIKINMHLLSLKQINKQKKILFFFNKKTNIVNLFKKYC